MNINKYIKGLCWIIGKFFLGERENVDLSLSLIFSYNFELAVLVVYPTIFLFSAFCCRNLLYNCYPSLPIHTCCIFRPSYFAILLTTVAVFYDFEKKSSDTDIQIVRTKIFPAKSKYPLVLTWTKIEKNHVVF